MATIRISLHSNTFTAGDTGLLSIHTVADRCSEADGCFVGIDVLLGRGIERYRRTV